MPPKVRLTDINYLERDFKSDLSYPLAQDWGVSNREAFIFALMRRGLNQEQVRIIMEDVWDSSIHDNMSITAVGGANTATAMQLINDFRQAMANRGYVAQSGLYSKTTYKSLFDGDVTAMYQNFYGVKRKDFLRTLAKAKGQKESEIGEKLSTFARLKIREWMQDPNLTPIYEPLQLFDFDRDQPTDKIFYALYDFIRGLPAVAQTRPQRPVRLNPDFQQVPDTQLEAAGQQVQQLQLQQEEANYDPTRTTTISGTQEQPSTTTQEQPSTTTTRDSGVTYFDNMGLESLSDEELDEVLSEQERSVMDEMINSIESRIPSSATTASALARGIVTFGTTAVAVKGNNTNRNLVALAAAATDAVINAYRNMDRDLRDGDGDEDEDEDLVEPLQARQEDSMNDISDIEFRIHDSIDRSYIGMLDSALQTSSAVIDGIPQKSLTAFSTLVAANQHPGTTVTQNLAESILLPAAASLVDTTVDVITEGPGEVLEFGKSVLGFVGVVTALIAIPAVAIGIASYVSSGDSENSSSSGNSGREGVTLTF